MSAQTAQAQVSAFQPSTTRVSVASGGVQANGGGRLTRPAVSADGRFVAFMSPAADLVSGDTNGMFDVFVHDRATSATTRVSVASGNVQASGVSSNAVQAGGYDEPTALSADGRFVAFTSDSTDLVANDTNATRDVFIHDRQTATTARVSVSSAGAEANSASDSPTISADGRLVAFRSSATNLVPGDTSVQSDVFVHDQQTGATTRVSLSSFVFPTGGNLEANGPSRSPAISADGRFVAFASDAQNLVPNDTNDRRDVFVRDRQAARTTRVSVTSSGAQVTIGRSDRPAISNDGRFVAFSSNAPDLVAGDTNGGHDLFVRDRAAATTTRVSLKSGDVQANPNFFDVTPAISGDGRFVAFEFDRSLVTDDRNGNLDVYVRDRAAATTTRVSVSTSGAESDGVSVSPAISGDGRFVAFASTASNLVPGDTNVAGDVFMRDRGVFAGFTGIWERVVLRCGPRPHSRRCAVSGRLKIANPGNRTARASRVHFYISRNRRLDRRDQLVMRLRLAPLRAGKKRTVRLERILAQDVAGRFLIAKLDATGKVEEPNEQDNVVVSRPLSRRRSS